jgi:hypothetical protein
MCNLFENYLQTICKLFYNMPRIVVGAMMAVVVAVGMRVVVLRILNLVV